MTPNPGGDAETTLVICKPDAVERGLVGEIIGRLERRGLRLVRAELRHLDKQTAATHYGEHAGKPFYDGLIEYITRSPVLVVAVGGPVGTWQVVRRTIGATNPAEADPGDHSRRPGPDHRRKPGTRLRQRRIGPPGGGGVLPGPLDRETSGTASVNLDPRWP